MAASDEQRPLKNEIKLALVGDAGVGKVLRNISLVTTRWLTIS
jgi:GTPase SAR1 family protein